jgi:hypothetical protein
MVLPSSLRLPPDLHILANPKISKQHAKQWWEAGPRSGTSNIVKNDFVARGLRSLNEGQYVRQKRRERLHSFDSRLTHLQQSKISKQLEK